MRKTVVLLALLGLLAVAPQVGATTILLTHDNCTGGCGTGPFGTVALTQGTDFVDILITLTPSTMKFVESGIDSTIDFNLIGNPIVTVTNLPANWSFNGLGTHHMDGFGVFDYSLSWGKSGGGNGTLGPIGFRVNASGITIADFFELSTGDGDAAYVAVDVMGTTGNTGAIGGVCQVGVDCENPPVVPEPASMLLLGSGLLGAGFLRRKR